MAKYKQGKEIDREGSLALIIRSWLDPHFWWKE